MNTRNVVVFVWFAFAFDDAMKCFPESFEIRFFVVHGGVFFRRDRKQNVNRRTSVIFLP